MTRTLSVENFKGVKHITLEPEGALVLIAGGNGAGKSSFIDAFVELFDPKGTRLTPMPIREGEDEARAEYIDTDLNLRIVRTWKKNDSGALAVYALDGAKYERPRDVVVKLTGGLIFDPVAFLNLDEKKQRDALLAKVELPFDLDALGREKAAAEERRLEAGREVKRLSGALASMPKPSGDVPEDEVSAADILAEIQAAHDAQFAREGAERSVNEAAAAVSQIEREILALQEQLGMAKVRKAAAEKRRDEQPDPIDAEPLRAKLETVEATNAAVRAAHEYARVESDLSRVQDQYDEAQKALGAIDDRKRAGLAEAKFPIAGLSVDDSGVTVDGIPFSQVNSAARRKVAFAIATAGSPQLRLVIVKDGDLLDSDSLAAIRAIAEERDYTVLVERDRDESRQIGFTIQDGVLA